jgi:hypothetical protein
MKEYKIIFGCSDPERYEKLIEFMNNQPVLDGKTDEPLFNPDGTPMTVKDLKARSSW